VLLDQGPNWTQSARATSQRRDQGSRIMPLRWMPLKQPNGEPFTAGSLGRYGYLPNSDIPGMPIGFTVAGSSGSETIGMHLLRPPHAADYGRQHRLPGRWRSSHRRFSEFPRRSRHCSEHGADQ
jgi:hypothetical protein